LDVPEIAAVATIDSDKLDAEGKANVKEVSFSAAVSLGTFNNNADASIGRNAVVDAGGELRVIAETRIPQPFQWDKVDTAPPAEFDAKSQVDDNANTISFSSAHGFTTGQPIVYDSQGASDVADLSNGTTYYAVFVNPTTTQVATSEQDANAGTAIDLSPAEASQTHIFRQPDDPSEFVALITDKLNSNLGLQNGFFTSWAQSTAQGSKSAVAGSPPRRGGCGVHRKRSPVPRKKRTPTPFAGVLTRRRGRGRQSGPGRMSS
jgi:hypothetical protein